MLALKFSSVVFGVTSRLTVTNKIHWYVVRRLSHVINKRRCLQIPAMSVANLPRSGASLFTTPDGLIVDNTKKRDIGRKERFFIPHLHHSTLPLGGARRNIATTFVMKKLERRGYPIAKKVWRYDYSFWYNARTWQTARQTDWQSPHNGIDRAYA